MVIFRQISPLPSCCDPDCVLAMSQDLNNVGCLVLDFSGSARVFLSPCFPLVTVWFLTMIWCVDFPLFPPGSTQVFDINSLHYLPLVSPGYSLDFSWLPWLSCESLVISGIPAPYRLGLVVGKSSFFSFYAWDFILNLLSAASLVWRFSPQRSSLTHLLPRGLKSRRFLRLDRVTFVSFVDWILI